MVRSRFKERPPARKSQITDLEIQSNQVTFTSTAASPSSILINQVVFPGWKLYLNNQYTDLPMNSDGLWEINLEPGTNQVELKLEEPTFHKMANSITVISILTIVGGVWHQKKEKRTK